MCRVAIGSPSLKVLSVLQLLYSGPRPPRMMLSQFSTQKATWLLLQMFLFLPVLLRLWNAAVTLGKAQQMSRLSPALSCQSKIWVMRRRGPKATNLQIFRSFLFLLSLCWQESQEHIIVKAFRIDSGQSDCNGGNFVFTNLINTLQYTLVHRDTL